MSSCEKAPDLKNETRFAVVMYGGVSLAIYIYGVAKELYSMARATARRTDDAACYLFDKNQLSPTEIVYREMGEYLGTKFVVDILSGTSAGGINSIYLAKALANGQSFETLKDIWLEQGDIARLINDNGSKVEGLRMEEPPESLLNSRRMYYHLLKVFWDMKSGGAPSVPEGISPFVNELDLYITATDIRGKRVRLPVANAEAEELRFRTVFHFVYRTERKEEGGKRFPVNDFEEGNDPFLAYAARCTSSFPFAFAPMRLKDIEETLKMRDFEGSSYRYDPQKWSAFYEGYDPKTDGDVSLRSFGDGGYLDNKPFSYITDGLLLRRAERPVDRKLIYIDPTPEHPIPKDEKPDAVENALAALTNIPRYEPIREDLERVLERNRLIRRINRIAEEVKQIVSRRKQAVKPWQKNPTEWAKKYFDDELIDWFGLSYAAYHQLRLASVLEQLKWNVLIPLQWQNDSEKAKDFALLLEGWKDAGYATNPDNHGKRLSANDILFRLDLDWRKRRIFFMQSLMNTFLTLTSSAPDSDERRKALEEAKRVIRLSGARLDPNEINADELLNVKAQFNDIIEDLESRGRRLCSRSLLKTAPKDPALRAYAEELSGLRDYLMEPSRGGQCRLAVLADALRCGEEREELNEAFKRIESLTCVLSAHPDEDKGGGRPKGYIHESMSLASRKGKIALGIPKQGEKRTKQTKLQKCLAYYYERFEYYDMMIFPIQYGTGVEETDEVEIVRISPRDANSLINEKEGKKKLAGTVLANFGAFFAREWRENDMMWGRLDAAECLSKALLPEGKERERVIERLNQAILEEEFSAERGGVRVFEEEYERINERVFGRERQTAAALQRRLGLNEKQERKLYAALSELSKSSNLLGRFKKDYSIRRDFPPAETLSAAARALRVTGDMLNGISASYAAPAKWLTSAGGILAGILSAALPDSLGNLLFTKYLTGLLYLFEILLVAAGWLTGSAGMKQLGFTALALTFLSHLGIGTVNRFLAGKIGWKALRFGLQSLASLVLLALIAAAVFLVYLGLNSLGVLELPGGALGGWLARIMQGKINP